MNDNGERTIREDWQDRQRREGNVPRAVLMKGLHDSINAVIDRWHRAVLARAFAPVSSCATSCLDLGCGYGRLADSARELGLDPLFGLDFSKAFCSEFSRNHGPAVCASVTGLPFKPGSLNGAYAITALMYLPTDRAAEAMGQLDRCLHPGSRVLLLEPSREFNALARRLFPGKRDETLAVPGFSKGEFFGTLPPDHWSPIARGACPCLTLALPAMMVLQRLSLPFRWLAAAALALDRLFVRFHVSHWFLAMYRWAIYEKPNSPPPVGTEGPRVGQLRDNR